MVQFNKIEDSTPISFLTIGQFRTFLETSVSRLVTNSKTSEGEYPEIMDKSQCSRMTRFTVNTINKMICECRIPYYKNGAKVYFKRREILEWMLKDRRGTANELSDKKVQEVCHKK